MIHNSNSKRSPNICFQCGSELIFVSRETVQPEGSRYPQINTIYRCSNIVCQEKKDKEKADRLKLRQTREETEKERLEKKEEKKKLEKEAT